MKRIERERERERGGEREETRREGKRSSICIIIALNRIQIIVNVFSY